MSSIKVNHLSATYDKIPALWEISVDLPSEKIIGVIGPNGSGKSTFIKAILNLGPKVSGDVRFFNDKNLEESLSRIAYLPQREGIDWNFPITALDVVLMGTYHQSKSKKKSDQISWAKECLDRVGLIQFAGRQISELSGGQQQRMFIARALAQKADLFLLDEPFAAVDAGTEKKIMQILHELKNDGKTVIIIHHNLQSVIKNMDLVMLLNTRLVKFGKTQEVMTEENLSQTFGPQLELFSRAMDEVKRYE